MQKRGFCGDNVTLPDKERGFGFYDKTTSLAGRLGAVYILWFDNGCLCGDNIDVGGFLDNLDEQASDWDIECQRAVVLGAGGAAKGILAALAIGKIRYVTI
jgi:shikimate dehydrogenase